MIKTNLAVLMAERGLKISDLYEATGISKTTLMAISENTGKGIQYDTIDKLCNFLNISPTDFFVYSPYIFKFHKDEKSGVYLPNIVITVKKASKMKSYSFFADITTPQGMYYPVTQEDADLSLSYDLTFDTEKNTLANNGDELAKKNYKEFYDIYSNLPISLKSELNKEFLSIALDNLSKLNGENIEVMDGNPFDDDSFSHNITIKNGMRVIANLFDGRFTRLSKVPLFVVNGKDDSNKS